MPFLATMWTTVITVVQYFTPFTIDDYGLQRPFNGQFQFPINTPHDGSYQPPVFYPPGSNIDGFRCDYATNMGSQWVSCTDKPGCWINNTDTGETYGVWNTDYETTWPIGITRNYTLVVTDQDHMNQDGIWFTEGKQFNNSFPGPLLEACWGDRLNITVVNNSTYNGTSIHWHGIRQLENMQMDGVNGITQCPIAPGDSFNYIWNATQYGSSWYHSHYSVQYADGLQAPITLHGPSTLQYDEAVEPLIMSDWLHRSAFEIVHTLNTSSAYPTIVMNGRGNCTRFMNATWATEAGCDPDLIPEAYSIAFADLPSKVVQGKKRQYLLRIINTSFASSLIFSIDNHLMTIVEADFVPVNASKPQQTIHVAIGQRYHVIVEANPQGSNIPADGNFWIRTHAAGCIDDVGQDDEAQDGYNRTAILRYNTSSTVDPISNSWPADSAGCFDTLTPQLVPALSWTVEAPSNGVKNTGEQFNISRSFGSQHRPYALGHFALNRHNASFTPFQTTYGDPTFLNLDNFLDNTDSDIEAWPAGWVVIPENYTATDWVYLILPGGGHPIHLHGHDFAIVEYSINGTFTPDVLKPPYINPMRRDVVLLPAFSTAGYVVIAFKTDNPGAWLMHCHIALHASWGLSLQILERQRDANLLWPPGDSQALQNARSTCANWNTWAYDCELHWPGLQNETYPACDSNIALQDDSGI